MREKVILLLLVLLLDSLPQRRARVRAWVPSTKYGTVFPKKVGWESVPFKGSNPFCP